MNLFRLVAIDAMNLIHQNYHGMPVSMVRPDASSDPMNTNAIHGFTRDVLTLRRDLRPDWIVTAYDGGNQYRQALYPAYKAQRKPACEDLRAQFRGIAEMLQALRVSMVVRGQVEADDAIGSIVEMVRGVNVEVVIVTTDKDMLQLVSDRVRLYHPRKKTFTGPAELLTDRSLFPWQVVDYLAMVGDASDNIPGIEGIGEVTALELLASHGDWAGIVANDDLLKPAVRRRVLAGKQTYPLMRQLVEIRRDIDLNERGWNARWRTLPPDIGRCYELCGKYGIPLRGELADDHEVTTDEGPRELEEMPDDHMAPPPPRSPKPKSKIENPKSEPPTPVTDRQVRAAMPGVSDAEAGKIRRFVNRRRGVPEVTQGELF